VRIPNLKISYSISDLVFSGKIGLFERETEIIQAKCRRRFNIPKSDGLAFLSSEFQMMDQRQALTIVL
jgi:hypothetical protein